MGNQTKIPITLHSSTHGIATGKLLCRTQPDNFQHHVIYFPWAKCVNFSHSDVDSIDAMCEVFTYQYEFA